MDHGISIAEMEMFLSLSVKHISFVVLWRAASCLNLSYGTINTPNLMITIDSKLRLIKLKISLIK